jgi:hypothetical protein
MATLEKKRIKDFVKDTYKIVEKFVVEYTYDGEKFTHYYDVEKKANDHLSDLKKLGGVRWQVH